MRVLVGIPTRGTVSIDWALTLSALEAPEGVTVDRWKATGYPIDHMRNDLVETALRGGYDYLFFVDDDTCVPPRGLTQLLSRKLDVVSGLYMRRYLPIEPVMQSETESGRPRITDFKIGELVEAAYVGAGCLLLSRKVLEMLPYPWFKWTVNDKSLPNRDRMSEDMYFCRKAREAGFKVFMDTSVRCLHLGPGKAEVGGVFVPESEQTDKVAFGAGPITAEDLKSVRQ